MEESGSDVLSNVRSNDLARTAPGRECVEDHDLVVLDGGLELGLAGELLASIPSPMPPQSIIHLCHRREANLLCDIVDTHSGGSAAESSVCRRC